MTTAQKNILKMLIYGAIGALAGFAYYYFIGCKSGACPLSSNWKITTIYGFVSGVIVGIPSKKKNKENQ